ncbi:MAG TPA: prolipoprotein diacylglyceryl transferase [Sumerlaeia bacterium]|nr:prolipoprotein diacylglyceryl transferase [Sumerlaeia bacterium]
MHPILVSYGSFFIGAYGMMLALALFSGAVLAIRRSRRVGLSEHRVMDLVFLCLLGGIVGGRLTYVAVDILPGGQRYFLDHLREIVFSRSGFVFLGGLAAAIPVGILYCRKKGLNPWFVADVLAPSLAFGHALGRVGCFLAGCCYGRIADPAGPLGFLAVRFPKGSDLYPGMAFEDHLRRGLIDAGATTSLPVWPVQLFESGANLVLFLLLALLWRRRRFNGQVFLSYLAFYAVVRFALEFLRGDAERGAIGLLSTSQAISLAAAAFALVAWRPLVKSQNLLAQARGRNDSDGPALAPSQAKKTAGPSRRKRRRKPLP